MFDMLTALGFSRIGEVVEQRMVYESNAGEITGDHGAVYVFANPNGSVWKVGMTKNGFSRVNYTRVLDSRAMKRPHERRKLELIRDELHGGATQWVIPTDHPELMEALLCVALNPNETRRQRSKRESLLRSAKLPTDNETCGHAS